MKGYYANDAFATGGFDEPTIVTYGKDREGANCRLIISKGENNISLYNQEALDLVGIIISLEDDITDFLRKKTGNWENGEDNRDG